MVTAGPLGLSIPVQTQPAADTFLLDPERTQAWISNLPLANAEAASKQILEAIATCNRIHMAHDKRLKVVEHFRAPHAYITKTLEGRYIHATFPLSSRNRNIAMLNRRLQIEMAISHKIIIRDLFADNFGGLDRRLVDVTIQRTLAYIRRTLLQSYLIYEPCPNNTWREIHRLAAYGLQNSLHAGPPERDVERGTCHIADSYIRILLLALAAPYELQRRQTLSVVEAIAGWSCRARLRDPSSVGESAADDGLFVADLASDDPPWHLSLKSSHFPRHAIILDTGGLIRHLRERLDTPASQGSGLTHRLDSPDRALLIRLRRVWSRAAKRKQARTSLHFQVRIVVGLTGVCRLMQPQHPDVETAADSGTAHSTPSDRAWREQTDMLQHTLRSGFLRVGENAELSLSLLDAAAQPDAPGWASPDHCDSTADEDDPVIWSSPEPANHETHIFRTIDESVGGYCVSWTGDDIPQVTIGELIGIQSETDSRQFGVARVQWMRITPDNGLNLGLQILAPRVLRVTLIAQQDDVVEAQTCLLLPGSKAPDSPPSLITPPRSFRVGDKARLKDDDRETRIRLTRRLDATGAFFRFLFAPETD